MAPSFVGRSISDLNAEHVRSFLATLEQTRGCGVATRNVRLAAIRSLAWFVAERGPEHIGWSGEICSIPFKKADQRLVPYLEKSEMDALLDAPDQTTDQGRRDYILLLFLYNTGARVSEAAQLIVGDLNLARLLLGYHSRQGQQVSLLPALASDSDATKDANWQSRTEGESISKSASTGYYPLWRLHDGRTLCD